MNALETARIHAHRAAFLPHSSPVEVLLTDDEVHWFQVQEFIALCQAIVERLEAAAEQEKAS